MKKSIPAFWVLIFVSLMITSCSPKDNSSVKLVKPNSKSSGFSTDKNALPVISFEKEFHDFGKIKEGEKITYAFKFKNTGKSVLHISTVSTSCGCTVSAYPKQPIQPGEESSIDVSFDGTGKHGLQTKSITIYTNAQPSTTTLRIQSLIEGSDEN